MHRLRPVHTHICTCTVPLGHMGWTEVFAHLKACFNDGEWQHADTSHSSGTRSKQNSFASIGRSVQKIVLLQGVEGAEVDAHTRDAADKWLSERQSGKHYIKMKKSFGLKLWNVGLVKPPIVIKHKYDQWQLNVCIHAASGFISADIFVNVEMNKHSLGKLPSTDWRNSLS